MKDRLITLLGALLALYLLVALLMPRQPASGNVSLPTSVDAGTDGFLGLKRWLDKAGVPALSLRERYTRLAELKNAAERGNLLIVSLPQAGPGRVQELADLRRWLNAGNDILVLAAVNDWPEWLRQVPGGDISGFTESLGFRFTVQPSASEETPKPKRQELKEALKQVRDGLKPTEQIAIPADPHPLLTGVREIGLQARPMGDPRVLEGLGPRYTDNLLKDRETGTPVLWRLRIGAGNAWVFSHAGVFGNASLGERDHARLLANLLGLALRDKGAVIFDDMHQGLSALYDPSAFFRDPRLHHTLWFALGLWLLWVMGHGNRLGPVMQRTRPVAAVDLVRAVGGFFARRLNERGAAQRLLQQFLAEVCAQLGWPRDPRNAWTRLAEQPGLDARALAGVRAQQERLRAGLSPDLPALCNDLAQLRKDL